MCTTRMYPTTVCDKLNIFIYTNFITSTNKQGREKTDWISLIAVVVVIDN